MTLTAQKQSFIKGMERVGRLASETLQNVEKYLVRGITANEINTIVHDYTLSHGAIPAPLGYEGFPKSVCTSINDMICHGVPTDRVLCNGDIINVDVTTILDGFYGDTSRTFIIGEVSPKISGLVKTAEKAMYAGIEVLRPGVQTGDIGHAVEFIVKKSGFAVCKDIGGHGIGTKFHDDPFIPAYGRKGSGVKIPAWTCITVEPAVNESATQSREIQIPGSTITEIITKNGCLSAQFEHTVLITDQGYQILTLS